MIFNERLKALRKERWLSQEQAAKGLFITLRNYQRLESGSNTPNYTNFLKIANFFDVSLDYLAGRTDAQEVNR